MLGAGTILLCFMGIVLVTVAGGGGILNVTPAFGLFTRKYGNIFHSEWHPNITIMESKSPAVPGRKIVYCLGSAHKLIGNALPISAIVC